MKGILIILSIALFASFSFPVYASDAFRHTCWSAILTKRIGETNTKKWTDAHESTSSGIDKQMDLFNNTLGRSIGRNYGQNYPDYVNKEIADKSYSAIKAGQGRIIVNNNLVSSAF